jgi:hypothetical protein
MILSLGVAFAISQSAQHAMTVSNVQKHASFAGKLGDRVNLEFDVLVGGHLDHVVVGRQHTRAGSVLVVQNGDRIRISGFQDAPSVKVMADQIQIVR